MNKKKKHKGFDTMKKSKHKKISAQGGSKHSPAHMREIALKRWSNKKGA